MTTAPFAPEVLEAIRAPVVTVEYTATAHTPALGTFPLSVVGGTVSYSDKRSPRVAADLTCAWPSSEQVAALDPRARVRVVLTVAYVLPNGTRDVHDVADLGLRRRSLRRPDGLLGLTLASDEALLIDAAPNAAVPEGGSPPATETKTNAPAWVATMIGASLAWIGVPSPSVVVTAPVRAAEWPTTIPDYWDALEDVADQLDLEIFDPGDRVFRVAPRATVASRSVLTVNGGPGGILLSSDSAVSRDDWANYVALRYEWSNSAGARQIVYGTARVLAGPYAVDTAGYKNLTETRDRATTQTAANAAAASILGRLLSRSRALSFTTPPAWWVRPGHTITYSPEAGPEQRHLVSEIVHDLAGLTMDVTTRLPDKDSTIGE